MQALLLSLALIVGCCSALDIKVPSLASNDSSSLPSVDTAMTYATEMMMVFTNMSKFISRDSTRARSRKNSFLPCSSVFVLQAAGLLSGYRQAPSGQGQSGHRHPAGQRLAGERRPHCRLGSQVPLGPSLHYQRPRFYVSSRNFCGYFSRNLARESISMAVEIFRDFFSSFPVSS